MIDTQPTPGPATTPQGQGEPPGRGRRSKATLSRSNERFALALLLPALIFVAALIAYPLFVAIQLSLTPGSFSALRETTGGVSLEHFVAVFSDRATLDELGRTAVYVVGTIVPAFAAGLMIALLLRHRFAGRRWLRSLVLLPWAVPSVAASAIFLWMLDGSLGIVNKVLSALGLIDGPVAWYSSPDTAMAAVIVPTVWKQFPFFAMILLAALQTVPNDLYESAKVDGASRWRQFTTVTWPGIRGAAYAALVIGTLGVYREFDFIYPLTRGGPNDVTSTLAISIYREAFQFSNMGFASALGIVSTLLAAVFVIFGGRIMARNNL